MSWIEELQNPKLVNAMRYLSSAGAAASEACKGASHCFGAASDAFNYASTALALVSEWQEQGAEVKSDG